MAAACMRRPRFIASTAAADTMRALLSRVGLILYCAPVVLERAFTSVCRDRSAFDTISLAAAPPAVRWPAHRRRARDTCEASRCMGERSNRAPRVRAAGDEAEPRLRSICNLADMILHVSASDQAAERSSDFASTITPALNWQLLRTPLKTMRSTSTVIRRRASPPTAVRIGFLGNGQTATNHQGVQWFLIHCWAALRQRFPKIRLRLVGRKPGVVYNSSGVYECKHGAGSSRCGWAWGTPFEGREKENGIDELSFLNQEGMLYEAMSWRGMVAPIRATTGINTKLLVSLELGVPLVVTTAAAAPLNLGLYSNRSTGAASLADEPTEFIAACSKLLSSDHAWRTHSKAALEAYQRMEAEDPAASDMRKLLSAACDGGHGGRWAAMMDQQQAHPTPQTSSSLSVDASIFDNLPSLDKLCEVVDDVAQGCAAR